MNTRSMNKKWAAVYANSEFTCVQTCSGLRRTALDPDGVNTFLGSRPDAEQLGGAIRAALVSSRTLSPEELGAFFDLGAVEQRYERWVSAMMRIANHCARREIFKYMRHCSVELTDGTIFIQPTFHEKLEAWSGRGIGKEDYVVLPETVSDKELGEGALLALSRCIDP